MAEDKLSITPLPPSSGTPAEGSTEPLSRWARFKDSFKPMDDAELSLDPGMTALEKAIAKTATAKLNRSLKSRHLQMIAIGGSIGTGSFVGSGGALSSGGPAAVLIAWILVGAMMFCTVHASGESAVTFPVSGAFATYSTRFLDPSWGFAMGWNYAMQWLVVFPLESVAASITINFWDSTINHAAWVSIFWVVIVMINFFGVKGYGEAEFAFSSIKVIAVVGFIILGIVLVCGGGPQGGYIGGKYWHHPGAFAHSFKGVCNVFVTAAFSFAGTELCGSAAAETQNPRKSSPSATKQVFWRITSFYIISSTLVGLLVPYTDKRSISKSSVDASASPFVIAIRNAGIGGLPSVMNVVIMIAVSSVGNSSIYGCSRTLAALAAQGQAPAISGYIDRSGRPLVGIIVTSIFGSSAFIVASPKQGEVFSWLSALSGLSSVFTWGSICLCHVRFRYVLRYKGRGTDELAFTSMCGVYGSWFGFILNALILVAQFWVAVWPIGEKPDAEAFFQSYLAAPVVSVFYIGHKLYTKNWKLYIRADEMDIDSGRREVDLDSLKQESAEEKAYLQSRQWWYRTYKFWC